MSYRTLLAQIDDDPRSDARLKFSFEIARRFNAHLVGFYAGGLHGTPRDGADRDALAARARHAALGLAERAGVALEWRAPVDGAAPDVAVLHARHADLLVLGQPDPRNPTLAAGRHFVEDMLMRAGRPAIVLPHAGALPSVGNNVLIGWDGGRECARAVADALPLIARARFTTAEIVQPRPQAVRRPYEPQGIELSAWLERHGIRAAFGSTPHGMGASTGATLLNLATDLHADLIVAGAYGHSRFHERVLGGVTRNLLESMTVPVFMSH